MWLTADYRPTTFFTLRPANATSSGGKTLLVPTPFALKMALLDACIRTQGVAAGEDAFPLIRDVGVAVRPPRRLVVNNTFIKILRRHRGGPRDANGTGLAAPMGNTIAFREYVQYGGPLTIAIGIEEAADDDNALLEYLLTQINYLGKRGGFMQMVNMPARSDTLPDGCTRLNAEASQESFSVDGVLQLVDDCGSRMTFEHANIYSGKYLYLGRETGRVLNHVILPYRAVQSSRGFTLYERIE